MVNTWDRGWHARQVFLSPDAFVSSATRRGEIFVAPDGISFQVESIGDVGIATELFPEGWVLVYRMDDCYAVRPEYRIIGLERFLTNPDHPAMKQILYFFQKYALWATPDKQPTIWMHFHRADHSLDNDDFPASPIKLGRDWLKDGIVKHNGLTRLRQVAQEEEK